MHKIASQLGDPIKSDGATRNRDILQYAMILIEIKLDQGFPDSTQFRNEYGELIEVPVMFE